jgi:hypothetical protein
MGQVPAFDTLSPARRWSHIWLAGAASDLTNSTGAPHGRGTRDMP